jgi:hypothetical protein
VRLLAPAVVIASAKGVKLPLSAGHRAWAPLLLVLLDVGCPVLHGGRGLREVDDFPTSRLGAELVLGFRLEDGGGVFRTHAGFLDRLRVGLGHLVGGRSSRERSPGHFDLRAYNAAAGKPATKTCAHPRKENDVGARVASGNRPPGHVNPRAVARRPLYTMRWGSRNP